MEVVTFKVLDSIGIITLNSPPGNELAIPEFIPINMFHQWISTTSLKGLIIKGEGKNFSMGGHLDSIFKVSNDAETLKRLIMDGFSLLKAIEALEVPVIAAINRICFGGALEIALACDIRVASVNALLAFPEVNQNLMPGLGGTFRLPALTGFSQSARIILGGDILNATDAKDLGIIDYIAPKDHAFEHAFSLMQKMTHDRPVKVIRSIIKALKNATELSQSESIEMETILFCTLVYDEAERRKTEEA